MNKNWLVLLVIKYTMHAWCKGHDSLIKVFLYFPFLTGILNIQVW